MTEIAHILIIIGLLFVITGGVVLLFFSITGLPKLPGDLFIKRGNFVFFFPIVTSILVSIILTIILNLFIRR